jgi:hypothetical protein
MALAALRGGVPLVLVQEMEAERGAVAFRHFFEVTPAPLLQARIYDIVALPLYPSTEHRSASLAAVAKAMGATPTRPRRSLAQRAGLAREEVDLSAPSSASRRVFTLSSVQRSSGAERQAPGQQHRLSPTSAALEDATSSPKLERVTEGCTHRSSACNASCSGQV